MGSGRWGWLLALVPWEGVRRLWRRKGEPSMQQDFQPSDPEIHVDPVALSEETARRERAAREALRALSRRYHAGTQPLTIAQARIGVMKKGWMPGEDEGDWQRK